MASRYWIKLFPEMIDDPHMARLPDRMWRRAIELLLLAGNEDRDGALPSVRDMAWSLRIQEEQLNEDLGILHALGWVHWDTHWAVNQFYRRKQSRHSDPRYAKWRAIVMCNSKGFCASCIGVAAEDAHHLYSYSDNPERRYDPENGVALCEECHTAFHKAMGWGNNTAAQFDTWIMRDTDGNLA